MQRHARLREPRPLRQARAHLSQPVRAAWGADNPSRCWPRCGSTRTTEHMPTNNRSVTHWALLLGAAAALGCVDAPTERVVRVPIANQQAVKFWEALASTRWNQRATDLLQTLPVIIGANGLPANTPSNGQAWASRM